MIASFLLNSFHIKLDIFLTNNELKRCACWFQNKIHSIHYAANYPESFCCLNKNTQINEFCSLNV